LKLLVISSAPVVAIDGKFYLYAPYEKEMQLWAKHADTIQFCCPIWRDDKKLLIAPISFEVEAIHEIQEFDSTSFSNKLKAIPLAIVALIKIFKAIQQADHIHLRSPGNVALLACFVQILFPNTPKTAKYAGNWDPKAKQPWSYRLQKWLLSNTFLTRNMQVLVYGEWPNQTKNVKPFFTATYSEDEIMGRGDEAIGRRGDWETGVKFLFVGTLSKGKQPLYAIQLVEELHKRGRKVTLDLYGEGVLRKELEQYVDQHHLQAVVTLQGNQTKDSVLKAYQSSRFLLLPSKSEGWPKVVAEAMFWGCVPLASPVSCVPYMLGNGSRGLLLTERLSEDINQLVTLLHHPETYQKMANEGQNWSRQFTTDKFEAEIRELFLELLLVLLIFSIFTSLTK
jgi:glycosyltransferase involved in cell wall biosynthesis